MFGWPHSALTGRQQAFLLAPWSAVHFIPLAWSPHSTGMGFPVPETKAGTRRDDVLWRQFKEHTKTWIERQLSILLGNALCFYVTLFPHCRDALLSGIPQQASNWVTSGDSLKKSPLSPVAALDRILNISQRAPGSSASIIVLPTHGQNTCLRCHLPLLFTWGGGLY